MKKLIFVILIINILSCKKNTETPINLEQNCKVKKLSNDTSRIATGNNYFNVTYVNQNITEIVSSVNPKVKEVFTYDNLGFLTKNEEFYSINNVGGEDTIVRSRKVYSYNSMGNISTISFYGRNYAGTNPPTSTLYYAGLDSLFYNNGLISERKRYQPSYIGNGILIFREKENYVWTNEDITSSKLFDYSGINGSLSGTLTINYTYDITKENKIDQNLKKIQYHIADAGYAEYGLRNSKHILTKTNEQSSFSVPQINTYTTILYDNGFVKSIKVNQTNTSYFICDFEYDCK